MLRFFGSFAKSWVASAIMGLLMLAFLLLGQGSLRQMFGGVAGDVVVDAGSHQITQAEFQKMFEGDRQAYQQRTGQPFPLEQAVAQGEDKAILQNLATAEAFAEFLSRSGIVPSRDVFRAEFAKAARSSDQAVISQLFDPVSGALNQQRYAYFLSERGMTAAQFEQFFRDEIASRQFESAMHTGFATPPIYGAVQATLLLESRDLTYFVLPAAGIPKPPPPTDAQLTALMQQFKDRLMLPERRKLTVVRFSATAVAPTVTVDPAQVQQQFDARKDSYGKPETRSLVEIPLNDPKSAPAVQAALAKGEDPDAVAKSVGAQAIAYADQPQSAIADAKAAAAAFQMKEGEVSGPVQGDFKTVVLKVTKVTPAQAPDFAAAKAQIEDQLRQAAAQEKALDQSNKYDDARQGGASMADAAKQAGTQAVSVDAVNADGKDLEGQVNPALSPNLLKTAFGLDAGGESDVTQDADKGEYYVVHVDQVLPPSLPGLGEKGVRPALTQLYYQQALLTALQAQATAAQGEIQKGATFEAEAAKHHAQVGHQLGMQRIAAQQLQTEFGQGFLGAAFAAKPKDVFFAPSQEKGGLIVARVDAITAGDPAKIAQLIGALRGQSDPGYLEGLAGALHDAATKTVNPRSNLELARNIMGIDPAMVARATSNKTPAKSAGPAQ